jgi:CMP-N-acetylneuraminic acid synthetase
MIAMAKKGLIKEAMQLYEKNAPKRFIRDHVHMQKSLKSLYLKNEGLKPVDFKIKDFRVPQKLEKLFET